MKTMRLHEMASEPRGEGFGLPTRGPAPLVARFEAHLKGRELLPAKSALTLAFSGGLDSAVLLDLLLTLRGPWGWRVAAAHFDHRMRAGSAQDAEWVAARCRALGVPCVVGRARRVPLNEAEARAARYAFLEDARGRLGAAWTLTAHHADDQAETVLLRLLRGSNPEGLSGVQETREPALVRPLLPFHRHELAAYARDAGIEYRDDPSNRRYRFARNRLRHGLWAGREEAEAARAALLSLARASERARRAWTRRLERTDDAVVLGRERDRIVVAAPGLAAYDDPTQVRLLRRWVRELGGTLSAPAARAARGFLRRAGSGAAHDLGAGILLRREYEAWIVERHPARDRPERPLTIAEPRSGQGDAVIGGRRYRVAWGERVEGPGTRAEFGLAEVEFPVIVRGWRAGDRLRRAAGRRSLKRVFGDRRVPRSARTRLPVVVDARDVLWVPGVERSARGGAVGATSAWSLVVTSLDGAAENREHPMER